jgi:protein-S-isoprenylcysteine O-methyltransferase Ste14
VSIVALARLAPASLEARLSAPSAKSQPMADRVVTPLFIVSFCVWFAFLPVDVFRLRLLPLPPLEVSVLGVVVSLAGYAVIWTTLFQNAFAAPIVKDQSERGQVLIDTGLYGHIRHPFYLGFLVFFLGLALWLESYAGVGELRGCASAVAALRVPRRADQGRGGDSQGDVAGISRVHEESALSARPVRLVGV